MLMSSTPQGATRTCAVGLVRAVRVRINPWCLVRSVGGRRSSYSHRAWTQAGCPRASKVVPNSPYARRPLRRRACACVHENPLGRTGGRRSTAAARSENGSGRGTDGRWMCARCPGRVGGTCGVMFQARSEREVQCKRTNHEPSAGSPETWCTHLIMQRNNSQTAQSRHIETMHEAQRCHARR
jgi:hypothetical protein